VAVRVLVAAGALEEAAALVERSIDLRARRLRLSMLTARGIVAEARGDVDSAIADYGEAADAWAAYGFGLEEARTRTGLARCLVALGRHAEAAPELERARELLEPLGAQPILGEVDGVAARVTTSA
jgi:tetratricopeptide (TPR) repeat protein